ncbi:murein L,D-transpeptidase catalytic domain family protein [Fusobacterium nucleatum]|uniref:murein L,D-transpeptidase catalytic domain family protein n=1 Tax=Fusobacterium nucleatum TaxID=851 RepID=UPI003CFF363B
MKKVLIFFCFLLIASNTFAEENIVINNSQNVMEQKSEKTILDVKSVYDSLNIKNKLDYSIFQKAYLGYTQIPNKNPGVLIIIDYTKPSNEERFYVLDLNKKKLVYSTRVAHSKNSGLEIPLQFSDDPNSYQSSLGFFVTLGEYNGAYGYSLRLKGLEENINANAEDRAIVIHGGDIVEDQYIKKFGFAGRSLGCPVLPHSLTKEIIDFIKNGRVLFIHGNDEEYINNSLYLSKLAPIFEGSPKNIVEIEKPVVITTISTIPTTNTDIIIEKKDTITVEKTEVKDVTSKENTLEENKKEEKVEKSKKENRKYPKEVTKKSLGLERKLK